MKRHFSGPAVVAALALVLGACQTTGGDTAANVETDRLICEEKVSNARLHIASCTRAIRAGGVGDDQMAEFHHRRCAARNLIGDRAGALSDCDKAFEIGGETVQRLTTRGIVKGALNRHDDAIEDYNRALALDPEKTHALNNRGLSYKRKKDYARAIADFEAVLKKEPTDFSARFNLAQTYGDQGKRKRAIEELTRLVEQDPKSGLALYGRAAQKAQSKDHEGALEDLDASIDLWPNFRASHRLRGFLSRKLGNYDAAKTSLDEAIRLGDNSPATRKAAAGTTVLIAVVEAALEKLGLDPGEVDGVIDDQTRDAVREYQKTNELAVDGRVTKSLTKHLAQTGRMKEPANPLGETYERSI